MKLNIENKDCYRFFHCAELLTNEIGYVAMDAEDIEMAFSEADEVEFYAAEGDTLKQVYEEANGRLSGERYDSVLMAFSVREDAFESVAHEIEGLVKRFVQDHVQNEGTMLWNFYLTNQDKRCAMYLLCSKKF